ncbi:MAG: ChbG/HpnK family deacetylase [Salinarimonas sp.]|nr:ChbG/HpnK family deacetylase [Salinarimonas sp.]
MANGSARKLIVCAQEFGLSSGTSHAALDLVSMSRVSAVAVLARGAAWTSEGPALMALRKETGIGLMLEPGDGRNPGAAIAWLLRTPRSEIARDFARQVAAFHDVAGIAPDFITSRFGFHSWPMCRAALFLMLERLQLNDLWLCNPAERLRPVMRRSRARWQALGAAAMAMGFGTMATQHGYCVNHGYAGFVQDAKTYPVWHDFERFCQYAGPAPMVFCRPAYADDMLERSDPIVDRRMRELMYLSSTRFADMLELLAIRLVRDPRESL